MRVRVSVENVFGTNFGRENDGVQVPNCKGGVREKLTRNEFRTNSCVVHREHVAAVVASKLT